MRNLFNWTAARLVAAFALALPLAAIAAPTATAVWRSNLGQSYTIGGNTYALKIYGAGTDSAAGILNLDGTVTVTNGWTGWSSPCFEFGSDVTSISVLVKFSGFAAVTDDYGACLAAMRDSSGNEVGAYVAKGATHLSAFYKASGDNGPTQVKLNGSDDAVVGNGYMLFSYSTSGGVKVYMGSSIDGLVGGAESGYKYSNKTISRLAIGGDADGAYYTPTGFTIEDVALFVGSSYAASDVADYVFPTVAVDDTATMLMSELNAKVAAFDADINYFSASPVVTLDEEPSDATKAYLRSALWNATVFIKDQDIENLDPTVYGNKDSTLKLSGVSGFWGATTYENTATPAIELEDSETEGKEYGFFSRNGYSFYAKGAYYYVHTPELKGSGTYKANTTGNGALFVADKFDNFTGKLNLEGKTVWLGTGAPEKTEDTWNNLVNFPGTVRLGSTIPANYSTWNVPNGYRGTVIQKTAANATETAFLTAAAWKGTCKMSWNPGNNPLDIVNYGNANSVIEITTNFGAYPTQNGGSDGAEVAAEVKIAEGVTWTVSNGWTAESYRTTFAKLSGAGSLTVNGTTSGDTAIPYTITRLEGFTGTLAGRRGQFTIGTIVPAVEPTPSAKLVNCTTTFAPILGNTEVYYNNAKVDDIELEFKAGDGIYVKAVAYVVFQQESGQSFIDVTNYYTTVSNAIEAAKSLKKTVVLVAQPDAADTYEISVGETINVKKGEFTFDGIIFPEGPQYINTTTEIAGVTQYKCAIYTATVQYPGQEPENTTVALGQILNGLYAGYTPAYAGTIVTVLDGSDATVGDVMPDVFTYNGEAHTYTLKTMVASITSGYSTVYYPTLAAAFEAATAGQTIKVLADNTLAGTIEITTDNLTLDLNGCTVTGAAGDHFMFEIKEPDKADVSFTIKDTSTGQTGKAYSAASKVVLANSQNCTFTLASGTLESGSSAPVYIFGDSTQYTYGVTISGGTLKSGALGGSEDNSYCIYATAGTITFTGGAMDSAVGAFRAKTVNVSGGDVTVGSDSAVCYNISTETFTYNFTGGTFNRDVSQYAADGYEVLANGDGTYGVREYLGWIYEAADHPNYTGSWSNTVDYVEGKIAITNGNTYTANSASDGNKVTLALTLSFDGVNDDDTELTGAKAAARLASSGFQLYMSTNGVPAWVDVAATGVDPEEDVDYDFEIVLDMAKKMYSAKVRPTNSNGLAVQLADGSGATNFVFAYSSSTPVQKIDFIGSGKVTSIEGRYEYVDVAEFEPGRQDFCDIVLSIDEADWLNAQDNYDVLTNKLSVMTQTALDNAYLLNLDITSDYSYAFSVSGIDVGDDSVNVEITLTRSGALVEGEDPRPINGTLTLNGTADLGTAFAPVAEQAVSFDSHADFGGGATTTTVTVDTSKTDAKFFQPVIE